ncbi:hypothetical protein N0V83_008333 [Neocucurbitaria cava]|uniref:Actin-like ATPase domain-containing protein n=1 Tax=Neocucurbitaria cava TaxID=798079 RepID=A0A9W8Y2T8_9PLEO|nr:hypothetical protein N0V83_008333 [Neocucurbitaria cava]
MMTSNGVPAYSHKSPEEIVTDYLTRVFEYLDLTVSNFNEAFRRHTATDVVVTVPTDWSYMAQNSTYRALTKAGFNRANFPRLQDILFITESEAAALYVARYYRDEKGQEFLKENQYFVLIDAGGGTVDIVSYQVKKLHPVLQLEQVGKPTGEKCGSIFINREFLKWLRKQLGETNYRHLDPNFDIDKDAFHASESPAMRYLMEKFDERKQNFDRHSRDLYLDLPEPLDNLTIPGIVNQGQITIPSIQQNVFLVGGFGASDYLQQQIEYTLKLWKIKFRTPKDSWTAVVQGAVVCGIEKNTIRNMKKTTNCRHSYAICLDELFSESTHHDVDRIQANGNTYAESQLIWLLNKGDLVVADEPRTVERVFDIKFPKSRKGTIKFPIYRNSSDDEERPTRFKNAKDELEPERGWGINPTMCQTTLKLIMVLDWDVLCASMEWKGIELCKDNIEY